MRPLLLALALAPCACSETLLLDTGRPGPPGDADTDGDGDGDTDGDGDADGDADTDSGADDTGTPIPNDPPSILSADAYCYEHTTGDSFWLWEANATATDPQGVEDLARLDAKRSRVTVLSGGSTVADYELVCEDTTGACYASFRESTDGIACSSATSWTFRFVVADDRGLTSAAYEVQGRQR